MKNKKDNLIVRIIYFGSKIPIFRLFFEGSPKNWTSAEEHLFDFNKTIITLSSTIVVLSFTLISLRGLKIEKGLLATSWICFFVAIAMGVLLFYLKFISRFVDRIMEEKADSKKYLKKDFIFDHEEIWVYFISLILMYVFSILELLTFLIGFGFLMLVAFRTL